MLSVLNDQTVGQSLTLECSIFTVRGIRSTIGVIWRRDGLELERSENINSITTNNSMLFTDTYTISQLSTADEDATYQCYVLINTLSPVTGYDSVTLNVTGKKNAQVHATISHFISINNVILLTNLICIATTLVECSNYVVASTLGSVTSRSHTGKCSDTLLRH